MADDEPPPPMLLQLPPEARANSQDVDCEAPPPQLVDISSEGAPRRKFSADKINEMLPVVFERIAALERVVSGQQAQLNDIVPMQMELVSMHTDLQERCAAIAQAHTALFEDHMALCNSLHADAATPSFASKLPMVLRRNCQLVSDASGIHRVLGEPGCVAAFKSLAGASAWGSLLAASKSTTRGSGRERKGSHLSAGKAALRTAPFFDSSNGAGADRLERRPSCDSDFSEGFMGGRHGGGAGWHPEIKPESPDAAAWWPSPASVDDLDPSPANGACAVDKTEIYAIGGRVARCLDLGAAVDTDWKQLGDPVAEVERIGCATGRRKWEELRPMTQARASHRVAVSRGMIYVVGGSNAEGAALKSCERFDATVGRWEALPSMLVARSEHALAVINGSCNGAQHNSYERFVPGSRCWEPMPSMSVARRGHTSAAIRDRLFVIGGKCSTPGTASGRGGTGGFAAGHIPSEFLDPKLMALNNLDHSCILECFDPSLGRWDPLPAMPSHSHSGCHEKLVGCFKEIGAVCVAGKLYVVTSVHGRKPLSICECYNPLLETWEPCPQSELLRNHVLNAVAEASGKLFVVSRPPNRAGVAACQYFDPNRGQWEELPGFQRLRSPCRAFCANSKLYVIGDSEDDGAKQTPLLALECLDPATGHWEQLPSVPRLSCETATLSLP
eukprot:gnl/TRDRNA2_/TRDRNA2_159626_c0_seq2.p1 gnl/TRDRNA2_/TRDRNA2_159626_c0~~gnl/TRDRNA2_/TRDRNA2_159626_c0_seq2.p1  ORF type:complete len:673 (-),score=107.47 gnl/TRDRNA2_/TRDRNA2_159626_c0_seq2:123-2141(-)